MPKTIETLKAELGEIEGSILAAYASNQSIEDMRPLAMQRRDALKALDRANRAAKRRSSSRKG